MDDQVQARGYFTAEIRDADGTLLYREVFPNGSTTAGLNDMLSVYFNSGTQKTTWYLGLINNSGFSALAAGDTMSSHAGWSELTGYSESARPTWTPGAPASGVITNSSGVVFTASGSIDVKGAFLVSDSTKGGTSGVLWATGAFASVQSLTVGQTLTLTYSSTLAP